MARTMRRGPWWLYDEYYRGLKWTGQSNGKRVRFRLRAGAPAGTVTYVGWRFKRELTTDGISIREGLQCTCCSADPPRARGRKRRAADRGAIREGLHEMEETDESPPPHAVTAVRALQAPDRSMVGSLWRRKRE